MHRILPSTLLLLASWLALTSSTVAQVPAPPEKTTLENLEALERKVLYHPRKYGKATIEKFEKAGGSRVPFTTPQGDQVAWLIPQTKGDAPERLWIVCGGNGTLALDLDPLCRAAALEADAFLLVDYPGYGECGGVPSPQGIRETMKESALAAAKTVKIDPAKQPEKVCVFGHSLGCSAALMVVEEFRLRSAVLCAPFTDTIEMAQKKFSMPATFPFQHKFDNRPGLKQLNENHGHAWIFHGDKDDIIPVDMSKALANEFKDAIKLTVIVGGRHNDIIKLAKKDIFAAMAEARKQPGN